MHGGDAFARPPQPLAGRRIWFVGIGGAGLSAYAFLARAWGAEVGGWDRADTPYLRGLRRGAGRDRGRARRCRTAGRSSSRPLTQARSRAGRGPSSWPSSSRCAPSIVVAGAHGKTTTSGMIAFVLAELGRDPSWLIGGELPQLGGNAGAGSGWLVVEGDESDRTVELLRPRIAVVTNVELDHHSTFASAAEVRELFDAWLEHVPEVVRGEELEPVVVRARGAGRAQPAQRRCRARGARARRRAALRGRARARPFPGRRPPFRARGRGAAA